MTLASAQLGLSPKVWLLPKWITRSTRWKSEYLYSCNARPGGLFDTKLDVDYGCWELGLRPKKMFDVLLALAVVSRASGDVKKCRRCH